MRIVTDSGGEYHRSVTGGGARCGQSGVRPPKPREVEQRRLRPCRSCYPPSRSRMKQTPKAEAKENAHRDRMDELRPLVFARAGYTCEVRSEGCTGSWRLQAHHRWPTGDGGPDTLENLVAACSACHTGSPAAIHRNIEWARSEGLLLQAWQGAPSEAWGEPADQALPRFSW